MRIAYACLAVVCATACGSDKTHGLADGGVVADAPAAHIVIAPEGATLTVTDNVPVTQGYTATLVEPDGSTSDVTATATWTLADTTYGAFSGPNLSVTGGGAGPSALFAQVGDASGSADFTVYVHGHRVEGTLPNDGSLPGLFASATEDPSRAPTVVYPSDNILVPPNLGQFDVHWTDATVNDVWEVTMANAYIDLRIYTQGIDPSTRIYTLFDPSEWYPIASTKQTLELTVAGLQLATPTTKGTAAAQHVDVTNENAKGGIYYWSTTTEGIYRYDVGTPDVPPAPFINSSTIGTCVGCHTLSRDGTKIALTLDSSGGRGTAMNVSDLSVLVPFDGATQPALRWDFSSFTGDGSKLVTVSNGAMQLRDINGGSDLVDIPNSADDANGAFYASQPEVSPDNTQLVNVEGHYNDEVFDSQGGIVIRTYDAATSTFGTPRVLVPYDPTVGLGAYYPSFSPDGQWIAYTKPSAGDGSYNNNSAEIWVVKADGSQAPVQLLAADTTGALTNSWPRWVPFAQTFGADAQPLFYLTFSTTRPFGVRIPGGGRPQIWMTPFFPAKAALGMDPSGPLFRVPFQDVATANHIAQWTQAVVATQPPQ